jgi:hypothetical protein
MRKEMVPETSQSLYHLTLLKAQEYFIYPFGIYNANRTIQANNRKDM